MAGQLDPKVLIPELAQLESEIKRVSNSLLILIESAKKLDAQFKSQKTTQSQVRDGLKQLTENEKILTNVDKERIAIAKKLQRTTAQITSTQLKEGKQLVQNQIKLREARKQARLEAEKDLGLTKKRTSFFKKMTQSLLATAGAYLGIMTAIRGIKNSIKTIADFEKAMDEVAAITGATDIEFKQLEKDALRLGATTSKTASQVSGLQKEFAKLGFSTSEILDATEATISLSIAAGSDLAQSAVVAASTVRGFGLEASETQRVVDVMAKSFSSSALDLAKFQTAMGIIAPVAKSAGVSLEEATSRLSVLTDAGIDASTAGTSLRNIFLELSKQGLTWDEAMKKINTSTDKNKTALELFGKRGATAALVLAENTEKANRLTESYNNAAGSALKMATVMEDNLEGDTKRLSSAWEGLILNFRTSNGLMRSAVQFTTDLVSRFSDWIKIKPSKEIENEQLQLNILVNRLAQSNKDETKRAEIITEINRVSPTFLKGLDTENLSLKDLSVRLREYNKEFINRIILQKQQEKIERKLKSASEFRLQAEKQTIKIEQQLSKITAKLRIEDDTLGKSITEQFKIIKQRAKEQNKFLPELLILEGRIGSLAGTEANYNRFMNISNELTSEREEIAKRLGVSLDNQNNKENKIIDSGNKIITVNQEIIDSEIKKENITRKSIDKLEKIEIDNSNFRVEQRQKITDEILDEIENETELLIQKERQRLLESDAIGKERVALNQEIANNILNIELTNLEKQLEISNLSKEERLSIEQEIFDKKLELKEQEIEAEKEKNEQIKESREDLFNVSIDLANSLFDLGSSFRDAEIQKFEEQKAYELELAGDNAAAKEAIEKKYDREISKIKRKQAVSDKLQGIFNAAINTAVAITKALPNIPLAILIGILGGIQIATIAAKPIPKFKHGIKGKKDSGFAVVGDAWQSEFIKLPKTDTYFETPAKPTLTYLPKGSDVIPHYEKDQIIQGGIQPEKFDQLIAEQQKTRKQLAGQAKHEQIITASGYKYIVKKIDSKTEYVNKNFRV